MLAAEVVVHSSAIIGMALVAFGMVLTPGPNMIYLVSRSVAQGWRAGLVSLSGTFVGFLVYVTMANLGLSMVFVYVPALYIALKIVGAVYLFYLSYKALRPDGVSLFEPRDMPRDPAAKLFRMGLVTNLLNPKAAIMYLALIPQFVDTGAGHVVAQGFALGGIQIAISITFNGTYVLVAGAVSAFLSARPAWLRWQRWLTGGLLGAVGLRLAIDAPARAAA
jgi:threonine/homoserine/homoserine lactone efflux protein